MVKKEPDCINRGRLKRTTKKAQRGCAVPRGNALLQPGRALPPEWRAKHSDESLIQPKLEIPPQSWSLPRPCWPQTHHDFSHQQMCKLTKHTGKTSFLQGRRRFGSRCFITAFLVSVSLVLAGVARTPPAVKCTRTGRRGRNLDTP